jgi:UDP-N-acetylmuramate--alanine ligase
VVVTSTAVRADNPEVVEARRAGIPVIPRAEMLAELMRLKYGGGGGGQPRKDHHHLDGGARPGQRRPRPHGGGGRPDERHGLGARLGKGDFMVAEADESDRSFLKLSPTVAIVTNIDREHLDTYSGLEDLQEAFLGFVNKVPFYGTAVLCLDDGPVQDILPRVERRASPTASRRRPRWRPATSSSPGGSSYTAVAGSRRWVRITLAVPGAHNVLNSLAAVAVGLDLGISFDDIRSGLESFTGVDRRFQVRGEAGGVTVVDDYGHHPTEIRATLETLRNYGPARRTVVLFQPHRYTRTQGLWDEFCHAFHLADVLLLCDIYPAGEEAIEGVTAEALAGAIGEKGHRQVVYAGT